MSRGHAEALETQIALIRGINVGRAKRVAMADLRALMVSLGYGEPRTALNSGNVVFRSNGDSPAEAARRIEEGMAANLVPARVFVLTATELDEIVRQNSLAEIADNPSRLMVAFMGDRAERPQLDELARRDWSPEALALGARAAYLWCPDGILAGRLAEAVGRALGEETTMRNWATLLKLRALAS